jgi:hypothetical protein
MRNYNGTENRFCHLFCADTVCKSVNVVLNKISETTDEGTDLYNKGELAGDRLLLHGIFGLYLWLWVVKAIAM